MLLFGGRRRVWSRGRPPKEEENGESMGQVLLCGASSKRHVCIHPGVSRAVEGGRRVPTKGMRFRLKGAWFPCLFSLVYQSKRHRKKKPVINQYEIGPLCSFAVPRGEGSIHPSARYRVLLYWALNDDWSEKSLRAQDWGAEEPSFVLALHNAQLWPVQQQNRSHSFRGAAVTQTSLHPIHRKCLRLVVVSARGRLALVEGLFVGLAPFATRKTETRVAQTFGKEACEFAVGRWRMVCVTGVSGDSERVFLLHEEHGPTAVKPSVSIRCHAQHQLPRAAPRLCSVTRFPAAYTFPEQRTFYEYFGCVARFRDVFVRMTDGLHSRDDVSIHALFFFVWLC